MSDIVDTGSVENEVVVNKGIVVITFGVVNLSAEIVEVFLVEVLRIVKVVAFSTCELITAAPLVLPTVDVVNLVVDLVVDLDIFC